MNDTIYIPVNQAGYKMNTCSHGTWVGARDNLIDLFLCFGQVYSWNELQEMGYEIKCYKLVEVK